MSRAKEDRLKCVAILGGECNVRGCTLPRCRPTALNLAFADRSVRREMWGARTRRKAVRKSGDWTMAQTNASTRWKRALEYVSDPENKGKVTLICGNCASEIAFDRKYMPKPKVKPEG